MISLNSYDVRSSLVMEQMWKSAFTIHIVNIPQLEWHSVEHIPSQRPNSSLKINQAAPNYIYLIKIHVLCPGKFVKISENLTMFKKRTWIPDQRLKVLHRFFLVSKKVPN